MTAEPGEGIALALLSFVAGSMDAIAFLTLGDVFTSVMTGNTILLGLRSGKAEWPQPLIPSPPLEGMWLASRALHWRFEHRPAASSGLLSWKPYF